MSGPTYSYPQPKKRKHEHDCLDDSVAPDLLIRSNWVWYEDGNVILKAENTLFRIHRTVLAARSEVFKTMFSLPQPMGTTDRTQVFGGCPVVEVFDKSKDIEHALRAIYGEQRYFERDPLELEAVVALLRIGNKYLISGLWKEAINRLCTAFPSKLADQPGQYIQSAPGGIILGSFGRGMKDLRLMLNLAHEERVNLALPALYLSCAEYSYRALLPEPGDSQDVELRPEILSNAVKGREILQRRFQEYVLAWLKVEHTGHQQCQFKPACAARRAELARMVYYAQIPALIFNHRIGAKYSGNLRLYLKLCPLCEAEAMRIYNAGSGRFWGELPGAFGFASWDKLKAQME